MTSDTSLPGLVKRLRNLSTEEDLLDLISDIAHLDPDAREILREIAVEILDAEQFEIIFGGMPE